METIQKKQKITSFSPEWWNDFLKTNKNFTAPCVIENVISPSLMEKLNQGVCEALANRFKLKDISDGFRLYIEKEQQKN